MSEKPFLPEGWDSVPISPLLRYQVELAATRLYGPSSLVGVTIKRDAFVFTHTITVYSQRGPGWPEGLYAEQQESGAGPEDAGRKCLREMETALRERKAKLALDLEELRRKLAAGEPKLLLLTATLQRLHAPDGFEAHTYWPMMDLLGELFPDCALQRDADGGVSVTTYGSPFRLGGDDAGALAALRLRAREQTARASLELETQTVAIAAATARAQELRALIASLAEVQGQNDVPQDQEGNPTR